MVLALCELRDVALMNASLKRLDPSLHDEILATVNALQLHW